MQKTTKKFFKHQIVQFNLIILLLFTLLATSGCTEASNISAGKSAGNTSAANTNEGTITSAINNSANVNDTVSTLPAVSKKEDNPIDKAFAEDFDKALSTVEMRYVAEQYLNAWSAELVNVTALIKKGYQFAEDKKLVDDYVSSFKQLGRNAFDLEMLNWGDLSEKPDQRSYGTGGPAAGMMAEAKIYKQAVQNLIVHYENAVQDGKREYIYAYDGKGAMLPK